MIRNLPAPLRRQVYQAIELLGQVICEEAGKHQFHRIERVRRKMKVLRSSSLESVYRSLKQVLKDLSKLSSQEAYEIAHAFALMMELMNACENAYRTYRLQTKRTKPKAHHTQSLTLVITAHPTEARSQACIYLFQEMQHLLTQSYKNGFSQISEALKYFLQLAWRVPMANIHKPSVEDEAIHLYSIVLREDIFDEILSFHQDRIPFYIHTWVGGDKDGHPGVDEQTMKKSLTIAREYFSKFIKKNLTQAQKDFSLVTDSSGKRRSLEKKMVLKIGFLKRRVSRLREIKKGDGKRIEDFRREITLFSKQVHKHFNLRSKPIEHILKLFELFPALVVPLEMREDAQIFKKRSKKQRSASIERMLETLKELSRGGDPRKYVCSLVVSMVHSAEDVSSVIELQRKILGVPTIPVVPLLETQYALINAKEIVSNILKNQILQKALKENWNQKFEVMVGYSDSSKETGTLPSRFLIKQALHKLDKAISRKKIQPIFFHGTGGSVARGGGSVSEQTEWWPISARQRFKMTVQGEMVQRSFSSPEILRRQVTKTLLIVGNQKSKRSFVSQDKLLSEFSDRVCNYYEKKVRDPHFLKIVEQATPYRYLEELKIGSRPTSRKKKAIFSGLRAIPWVLCWTQTRILFPSWWGIGSAWRDLEPKKKSALKKIFQTNPFFSSFVKLLGFTLQKVELPVWRIYLSSSEINNSVSQSIYREFLFEYRFAIRFVKEVSGSSKLLWFRPWLEASIKLRSAMIHPLNLLQIIALQHRDAKLLRETATGIASGMLTTG